MISEFQGQFRWLSNFWPVGIVYDGLNFSSVEHAYQAAKCQNPADRILFQKGSPGDAKRLGRRLKIRPDWHHVREEVMRDLLQQKFAKSEFRALLLNTGNQELQEGNRWGDTFWGIDLRTGRGQNVLGRLIMEIRKELQD